MGPKSFLVLGQFFGVVAKQPASQAEPFRYVMLNDSDSFYGNENLPNLQEAVFGMTLRVPDDQKIFRLIPSFQEMGPVQDVKIQSPEGPHLKLRLIGAEDTSHVSRVEMYDCDYLIDQIQVEDADDIPAAPHAEEKIIHTVLSWMIQNCPKGRMKDLDVHLEKVISLLGDTNRDERMGHHVPGTFNEFINSSKPG